MKKPQRVILYGLVLFFSLGLLALFVFSMPAAIRQARQGKRHAQVAAEAACLSLRPSAGNEVLHHFPQEAPDFVLYDQQGKAFSLSSLRGQVVLLHLWASWCQPCVSELPTLHALSQKISDESIHMVLVSLDKDWEDEKAFFTKHSLFLDAHKVSTLLDTNGLVAGQKYGTSGVPETYLIDPKGNIRYYFVGQRAWDSEDAKMCILALQEAKL